MRLTSSAFRCAELWITIIEHQCVLMAKLHNAALARDYSTHSQPDYYQSVSLAVCLLAKVNTFQMKERVWNMKAYMDDIKTHLKQTGIMDVDVTNFSERGNEWRGICFVLWLYGN